MEIARMLRRPAGNMQPLAICLNSEHQTWERRRRKGIGDPKGKKPREYKIYQSKSTVFGGEYDPSPSPEEVRKALWFTTRHRLMQEQEDGLVIRQRLEDLATQLETLENKATVDIGKAARKTLEALIVVVGNLGKTVILAGRGSFLRLINPNRRSSTKLATPLDSQEDGIEIEVKVGEEEPNRKRKRKTTSWDKCKQIKPKTHSEPLHKRPRTIWQPPGVPISQQQIAAEIRANILDGNIPDEWGWSGGKSPGNHGPAMTDATQSYQIVPPPPIDWFHIESIRGPRSKQDKFDSSRNIVLEPFHQDHRPISIERFKTEVRQTEDYVDLCIQRSYWSDLETPQLIYDNLRRCVVQIVRSFYGTGHDEFSRTLGGPDGKITQLVRETLSAAKLMDLLEERLLVYPLFGKPEKLENELVIREREIEADLKQTPFQLRFQLLDFQRAHIVEGFSYADHANSRSRRIGLHTCEILKEMRGYEHELVQQSSGLQKSLRDHMETLCRLAYNFSMLIKTHDQVWLLQECPVGGDLPIDRVDVVGNTNGNVYQGSLRGCVVALSVFPALYCSREGISKSMRLAEKGWVVIENLWLPPGKEI